LIFVKTYEDNENLFISIKDNANGVPEDVINRVFEPYFTTKHKSGGTGIGLYMCEEIIVKHMKGTITVTNNSMTYKNKKYMGAEFIIKLPKKDEQ
jgi:signal transduction histidine kinase